MKDLSFGKKEMSFGRWSYPAFILGSYAGEIRRTKLGTDGGGGWGWCVAMSISPLKTFRTVTEAKQYVRERFDAMRPWRKG